MSDEAEPPRRPIQDLAHDARLLRTAIGAAELSDEQRAATALAYDEVLRQACRALDVTEHFAAARRRGDAVAERERVEAALGEAGLRVAPVS